MWSLLSWSGLHVSCENCESDLSCLGKPFLLLLFAGETTGLISLMF